MYNSFQDFKKYTFTICIGRVWIVIGYFLFEKQAFNGILKVIGIQIVFKRNLITLRVYIHIISFSFKVFLTVWFKWNTSFIVILLLLSLHKRKIGLLKK